MKDPETGLTVASTAHLPVVLQHALARGQQEGSTPLVFFAQICKKISKNRKNSRAKDRLVVLSKDTLFVYSDDGFVKRKVRLLDITACVVELPVESNTQYRAFGLHVPSHYDLAFETDKRPNSTISAFVRALITLRRFEQDAAKRRDEDPNRELFVRCSLEHQNFHNCFELKKPLGGAQPIIPPILEVVSEEGQKKKASDHKLQLEEILTDLQTELHKYSAECWTARHSIYLQLSHTAVELRERIERVLLQKTEEDRILKKQAEINRTRSTTIHSALEIAQTEHACALERLRSLREEHTAALAIARQNIRLAEERNTLLQNTRETAQQDIIREQRELERIAVDRLASLSTNQREYEASLLLPSYDDLKNEITSLDSALSSVEVALKTLRDHRDEGAALRALSATLGEENQSLQEQVLAAMERTRLMQHQTHRLFAEVSTGMARRTRNTQLLDQAVSDEQKIEKDIQVAEERIAAVVDEEQRLKEKRRLLLNESAVCEDLQREALIHDSITQSIVKLMFATENEGQTQERALSLSLEEIKEKQRSVSS